MTLPDVVLLDLDGTITDSYPGIHRCLRHALPSIDMGHLTDEQIRSFLGPPLHVTLKDRFGKSDEEVELFVKEYRSVYFNGGEYECDVFPGMAELIADLGASDCALVLATAKPIVSAERVLEHVGLIEYFDFISGSGLDLMRQGKPDVIAHGFEGVGINPEDLSGVTAVMVGDRKEDVAGAHHFGLPGIGVRWGYADPDELEAAGADFIAEDAQQLRARLGMGVDARDKFPT